MEELKIEYVFDLKDFKMMENIEHSYFPTDNITPAEEVLNWYKKNNLTCIGLRNNNNEIIASVNVLPLNKEIFYDIYEDNKYALKGENTKDLKISIDSLREMQNSMHQTDNIIEKFTNVLNNSIGMERNLNKAITLLINEFEEYLTMTNTMSSSIDRIIGKANIVMKIID